MPAIDTPQPNATHVPVLAARCAELLLPALREPGAILLDATVGLGGHARIIADAAPQARVIGLDRDPQALDLAAARLADLAGRLTLIHTIYDRLDEVCADQRIDRVQAILFDLGVSSMQLDRVERGFSYAQDADLDMRMDPSQSLTAADVLNTYPSDQLERILRAYGEEPFARRLAAGIVARRASAPWRRTSELAELIDQTIPAPARRRGGNPAKRTFQALRIEVNGELAALERAIPQAINRLAVGGRIVVLAYHSLEDRIAKRVMADGASSAAPPGMPVEPEQAKAYLRLLTRGAEQASPAEQEANRRSASVRLRAAERIGDSRPATYPVPGRRTSARRRTGRPAGRRTP